MTSYPHTSTPAALPHPASAPAAAEGVWADAAALLGSCSSLRGIIQLVLEAALEAEMEHHLDTGAGFEGRAGGNFHNGHRPRAVQTAFGPVQVRVPRDRNGTFRQAVLARYRRDLAGREPLVTSLAIDGLPRHEFESRIIQLYGQRPPLPPALVADRVAGRLGLWQHRPAGPACLVLFAGTAALPGSSEPVGLAVAVTADGKRELLALWQAGPPGPGRSSRHWEAAFRDLHHRGLHQVCIVAGDGTAELEAAAHATWPGTAVHATTAAPCGPQHPS